ncbi:MAG TPA: hypothetical protein VMI53_11505 [Opitutaceae bacterium]|nr:hypothetical protein [Opitutaceae bacterium]
MAAQTAILEFADEKPPCAVDFYAHKSGITAKRRDAIDEAEKAGFDLSLVEASLALTPEERARQHDQALALVLEFDRIRRERELR